MIGGGEPTLHEEFIKMLTYLIAFSADRLFFVTNGTCSREVWDELIRLHSLKKLDLKVSKDPWHDIDKIKNWVWDDANKHKLWWGDNNFGTGDNRRCIDLVGRARENLEDIKQDGEYFYKEVILIEEEDDDEACLLITPRGKAFQGSMEVEL